MFLPTGHLCIYQTVEQWPDIVCSTRQFIFSCGGLQEKFRKIDLTHVVKGFCYALERSWARVSIDMNKEKEEEENFMP